MLSNFNLYKNEWLELVFAKRNKDYGAFYIRQHYADNVTKALAITIVTAVGGALVVGTLIAAKPATERMIVVDNEKIYIAPPPPKAEKPKPKVEKPVEAAPKPSAPVKQNAFPPPVVTADPVPEVDLPRVDDHTAVGPVTVNKGGDGINADAGTADKGGEGTGEGTGEPDGKTYLTPEKMPEPLNGMEGWTKFLQNTIRYPEAATSAGTSGKVVVSFIVEKDGSLSSFKVERGKGFGLDEEAIRVLKLAKPWKPGMQNGHPVRVKLALPISFMLGDN